MYYGRERFIRAHQDIKDPYYNHSYARHVRDVLCGACGKIIGEQVKYEIEKQFHFENKEKDDYRFCPYCGHRFW
jgi:DNA-directed RNA polymerase subunit RPC12/RpoP